MEALLQKATRQHTKTHNSRLVLRTIYDYGTISRAEVARLTHLTRATISEVVADLIRQGLVEEVGHGPVSIGRTPTLLSVVADSRQLIGIDIANGKLHGAIVNLRGQIYHRISLPLQDHNGEAVVTLLYEAIDTLTQQATSPLLGIGIGAPGLIDTVGGDVRHAVNLGWENVPLRDLMQQRYDLPVYIANDSHLAALAEYTFGGGHMAEHMIVLLVGRGIGAGIVLSGQLFPGDAGGAGEIGHVVVVEGGEPCRCGNAGCLETVASSRAIIQRAQRIARANPRSSLHQFAATPEAITLDVVHQAVSAADPAVCAVIREVGRYLGGAVAHLVCSLNIRRIVIAGRVAAFGDVLIDAIQQEVNARALSMLVRDTEIE
ncbi:MAG: ROK family transcriptional regulator, partial [Chloroflexi bacterium]|nr:ROK family transcriptional regulator [Chloroflexota bacterium]